MQKLSKFMIYKIKYYKNFNLKFQMMPWKEYNN